MTTSTSYLFTRFQRCALLWSAVLLTAGLVHAQTPASVATAESTFCSAPEYHQFDFFVGNWAAYDGAKKLLGHARVEKVEQGCVLQEWWRGEGEENGAGTSLSLYDRKRKLWHHTWASARGNLAPIDGGMVGNSMVMTGYYVNEKGERELHRTTWTPTPDGGVHQLWVSSLDGGTTWSTIHDAWLRKTDAVIKK